MQYLFTYHSSEFDHVLLFFCPKALSAITGPIILLITYGSEVHKIVRPVAELERQPDHKILIPLAVS